MNEPGPLQDQRQPHPVRERTLVHRGWVWNLVSDEVEYRGHTMHREYVDHTGAVAVLALNDADEALVIAQYRHPVGYRDWELPAGLLDGGAGESALAAAQRELLEEADARADRWHLLLDFWTSPGGSNEAIRIYLARGVQRAEHGFERRLEEADIQARWVALDALVEGALEGRIHNPVLLQAAFAANESRRRGWATLRAADVPWPTRSPGTEVTPRALADGAPRVRRNIDRYVRYLTFERGLSRNSTEAYRRDLNRYADYLADRGIEHPAQVQRDDARAFVGWLRSPEGPNFAASSASRIVSSVRGFHRYLDEEKIVGEDVAAGLAAPKLPRRLPKALTVAEVTRLLEAASGEGFEALRDRALLEVLYASGARISEAVGLAVDDVLDRDMVRVRGKGNKQRIVPLGSYAQDALAAYLVRARPVFAARGSGSPALFLGARGGALSRNSAWNLLQRVAERAELATHISPHTLRHSFATHLMQGGADAVVQELLGHASVSTTQIYTKVTADALREMYAIAHPRAR